MPRLLILSFSLLLWIPALLGEVRTEEEHEVLEGESLTVPCVYGPQYAGNIKYWCRGRTTGMCTTLFRTDVNQGGGKVSIKDDPVQQLFTVTIKDLKVGDSGSYLCGVEIGGMWSTDASASTYIKVTDGMIVKNSRLTGEEGSSVTVKCLYSEKYRGSEKKWCRIGNWSSCLLADSEDATMAMTDDRNGTFTVTLKNLQMKDAGWYWCSAGHHQKAVNVLVTPRSSTAKLPVTSDSAPNQPDLPPPRGIVKESCHNLNLPLMLFSAFMLLLCLATFVGTRWWRLRKRDVERRQPKEMKANLNEYSDDAGDLQDTTVVFLNNNTRKAQIY